MGLVGNKRKMIETIVFDFGGVLLNLDMQRTFDELSKVMQVDIKGAYEDGEFYDHYLKYEQGRMNDETLLWNIQHLAKTDPSPRDIVNAWNAMLLGWNPARLDMLLELRKKYNVLLLSNTNNMHISWVLRDLKRTYGIVDFESTYFDKVYYSHKIHLRKPNQEIYEYVSRDAALDPKTTLFIDDSPVNIDAAQVHGWYGQVHNPKNDIIDCIDKYLQR